MTLRNALRTIDLVRAAGISVQQVRNPEQAIVAVEKRREELKRTSWVCVEALTSFQRYVREFCGELL